VFLKQKRTRSKAWREQCEEALRVTGADPREEESDDEDIARGLSEEERDKDEAQKEDMKKYLENQIYDLEALTKALSSANDKVKQVIEMKMPEDGNMNAQEFSVAEAFNSELKSVRK
jgi:hypothetical protein